jgi:serine/threonine protein kinase
MGPANPHEKRSGAPPSAGEPIPPALLASPEYEVIREISRGGMGVVYLARNRRMDRLEGLKVVNQSLLAKAGALERFEREMRSAARLSHPNIVIAYSSPPLEGLLAFAMEYVDGTDLYHLVKSAGPLPVSNACYYIYQVAQGLQHAHDRNMVHRDIKPNNLMLTRDGKKQIIKILDFGLAKATSENPIDGGLTREGQMLGTPHYVAPEQSLNASKADIRADIYSLGCTLYYLLTGHPPFKDKESLFEILTAHHAATAPLVNVVRPDVPADLAAVVAKMMAKDAAQRYQQPSEVAQALAPYFKAGVKPISALKGAGSS